MSTVVRGSSSRKRLAHRARVITGVVICVLFLLPIVWMLLNSFKEQRDIMTVPPMFIFEPTLENYLGNLERADLGPRMLNTAIIAVGGGVLSVILGGMAGYALARIPLRGAATMGALILASRGVPPIALAVPMFLVARSLGVTDLHATVILAYCSFLIPYVMWLMRGFFMSLPKELEESAMIDGCSRFGAFWRIIVPISLPGFAATLIFSVILAWEELLFALVLTSRDASTIAIAIVGMASDTQKGADWGALSAVGMLSVIPVIILALAVQKWLIRGLAEGATKG